MSHFCKQQSNVKNNNKNVIFIEYQDVPKKKKKNPSFFPNFLKKKKKHSYLKM